MAGLIQRLAVELPGWHLHIYLLWRLDASSQARDVLRILQPLVPFRWQTDRLRSRGLNWLERKSVVYDCGK